MASSHNETKFNFGEPDVEYDSEPELLLDTNLTYATPQNDSCKALSYHHSVEKCNSLTFSHSHSFSYSHSASNTNTNPLYPTPQYSVDSISSPSELYSLKQWLTKFKIQDIYHKLIKAGYDSIGIFGECDDDDIKQIANDTQLSTSQRLKLKGAIRSIKNGLNGESVPYEDESQRDLHRRSGSVIITEREKMCMIQMKGFVQNIEECIKVIAHKSKDLQHEKQRKESQICKEFSVMFNILHERRMKLMNELHFIYQQKQDIFEQCLDELRELIANTKESQKQCSALILSQSLINYEDNILNINAIETKIKSICDSCLHTIGPININTNINVDIKTKDIVQILSVMGDINEDRECHEELSFDPKDKPRKRRKVMMMHITQHMADEWSECGDNLLIVPASNRIINIAKIRDNSNGYKGSGFASKVVYCGTHFWKLKISSSNDGDTAFNNFAIGFVAERYGSNKRNSWFLTHDRSIGIYSNKQIWCNGKKISSNKGIVMENRDIINMALDIDNNRFHVQRCKYNVDNGDYIVYPHKSIKLKRNALQINEGYRLGCYLRQKGQSITIVEYDIEPFHEWC